MTTLPAAIEAILFSSNRPLKVRELQHVTESDRNTIEHALDELRESLADRGLMLQRHHDQVQLVTRPEVAVYVRRALRPEVTGRLSTAAYETLAIIAYQQPVPKSKIEEIRGVNCDGVVANLELRNLVTEVGRGPGPGQPKLYGTTMRFLQVLGLESLKDLPLPPGTMDEEAAPAEGEEAAPAEGEAAADAPGAPGEGPREAGTAALLSGRRGVRGAGTPLADHASQAPTESDASQPLAEGDAPGAPGEGPREAGTAALLSGRRGVRGAGTPLADHAPKAPTGSDASQPQTESDASQPPTGGPAPSPSA